MKRLLAWLKSTNNWKWIVVICVLMCFLVGSGIYCWNYLRTINLPADHVFVCDNAAHDSQFDTWLKEDLGLDWVPTYLIIKDNHVIGKINGGISEKEFTSQLGTVLARNVEGIPVTDLEISNLNNERMAFNSLFSDGRMYIIEVSWASCKDCIEQDEKFTNSIYKKYGTDIIYRYYIRTEKKEVSEQYI